MPNYGYLHNTLLKYNSTIFKQQLTNISTVLNNTGNTTQLLTSFNALDVAQQKVLLSSKLLTEEQKSQCATMVALSSVNSKYTAEQLTRATGVSAETLATWGLTEATDTLTMSQLAEMASSDAQAKKVLEKIVAQNAQAVASGKVVASNASLVASETSATLATGSFTTAIKANIAAMWTWMTTTPLGWLTLLAAGIFAAVKAYDALTVSAEEASDKIEESRSAYEETTSTIESMNSELETTKKRIEELEARDALSFTDKAELDNLREQNAELERSISLLEKKRQNEAKQTVVDIKQNQETLDEDFDKSIKNLSEYKKEYEETRQLGIKGMAQGAVTLENYEATMAAMDKTMGQYESSVLDNIEKYEQYKEDIINKYGTDDISIFSQSDRALYNDIVSQLQAAYKEIYTNSEYNKFVIEPIFNQEDLKGLQDELLKYFINGGHTDLSSLEEKFGSDIITALRNACAKAGIDFDKMIEDMYNDSQSKLDQIAPLVDKPSGAYDAKQNRISKQIRDYIQNGLSDEDRTILLNATIPDDVKFKTKQDVDNFIASLREEADKTDISFSDIFSLKDAENNLTDLGRINEEIDKFQSAYKGLKEAMDSYNETGTFTLDQVQEIISYGGDYLKYLMDENGNLQLNEEALNKVAIARINEMRAKALSNLMDNLDKITNEKQALEYLRNQLLDTATAYDALTASRIKAWSENALENGISQGTINKVTKSFENQVSAINEMFNNISLDSIYKSSSSSAKSATKDAEQATKDAEQATKDYIDSYMNYMEKSLESGRIDYQTYSRDVAKFLKDMYDQGKIAAKDYHDYTKQMLEVQKDAMDSVISAVTNRLDKEIDFYEDQIDAVEERYQTEIDYLDTVIEYYEEQKKSLQDTNDELDRQKALEEALYNLHQKQTQKTIGLYTADKGKIYTTDASAIRDAEDNVRKAKLDIEIAKLDEAIEKVEQQQDALRDAMDKEKEQLQEIIDRLEEYKEQWQNVAKEYEIAQNEMMASQMLGADWESQILSGRIDTLNTFAQNYIAIQQAIANAAWASANAQIEAAKEAQKGANGNTGGAGSVGDKTEVSTRYKVVDESGKTLISYSGNNAQSKAESYKNRLDDAVHDLDKVKVVKYATGTKHAKKGLNLVGEDGTETFIDNDGNVSLVTKPSLIPMEGGEIVKNEKETKSLLDSMNLVPVQTGDIWKKFAGNMPDLSSMIKVNTPDYSKISGMASKAQTIEQHNQFNVTLPNITDSTKATKLFEELQR